MDKSTAAAFLNVSERTLNRYAASGKVGVTYKQQQGARSIADYNEDDLRQLKQELETEVITTATSLAPVKHSMTMIDAIELLSRLVIVFESLESKIQHQAKLPQGKLTLNLTEASELSGLSRNWLKQQLKNGALPGKKIGRGWRILTTDLNCFVDALFK